MRILRNPEVRMPLLGMLAAGGLTLGILAITYHKTAFFAAVMWAVSAAFAVCIIIFLVFASIHSKKVRAFTLKAQRNIRGSRELQFDEFEEGDFAVLQDVVQSMALAHARQEDRLTEEKGILKQSLEDITHQLKTPLQSLTLTAEQLMADEVTDAARKRAARKIMGTTYHVSELVATLLKLSRLDADAVTFRQDSFTAAELIERVCEPLEDSMELREITLQKNVPPEITLQSDLQWLTEALMNIVKNCMEHTPAGGTVFIDVSDTPVATQIVIRDTGSGIAEEDMPHLFERFYRGKDAGPNSVGIGLAFSQAVIHDKLHGTINPGNHPDGGAMFTVRMIKMNV